MEAWIQDEKKKTTLQRSETFSKRIEVDPTSDRKKSDVHSLLTPIYHASKICGLFPIKLTLDKSGKYSGHISYPQVVYGIFLALTFIGCQCWGMYRDLRDGWKNSSRLSSKTAITCTGNDIFAVISLSVTVILGSPSRCLHLKGILDKLVNVDEELNIATSAKLRKLTIIVISCTYLYLFMISSVDFIAWIFYSKSSDNAHFGDKGPMNYTPLYFMYIVIFTFEMQYALILFNIAERFLKLNKAIEDLTVNNSTIDDFRKDIGLATMDSRKGELQTVSPFITSDPRYKRQTNEILDFVTSGEGRDDPSESIDRLITIHGILCDCVTEVNEAYGFALLVGTISCLVHLVITPYFLYNQIYSKNSYSWYLLWLQVFWIFFHIYRLLLIVQPCYMVAVKARITSSVVSKALAIIRIPEAKKQLEIFSIQLLQRPVEFTACGMFFLNRGLLTSIAGSVTTYLVILVQFQEADDTKGTKNLLEDATILLKNASSYRNYSYNFRI